MRNHAVLLVVLLCTLGRLSAADRPPNIVIVFFDDLGWGDLGVFGAKQIRTPNIDRLASEGTRFTSFYVSQPVCSASRASLLTGCYANRIGIHGALFPGALTGIHGGESTLAEVLKARGYATGMVGKWHLGSQREFLPVRHGFDDYLGLPYSNDMWQNPPTTKPGSYPPLPLIDGDHVVETQPDQRFLTERYTRRAVDFIDRHRDSPFFLYVAHSMPHVPLHVNPRRQNRSAAGVYGDVIEELDESVGVLMEALRRNGLEDDTWVVITSDNGPWLSYGNHAGSAGPFREGKGTVYEGGVRVPCVMRWPGRIPAGRSCNEPLMTIDLLPTIAHRVGATLPENQIDGHNVWPVVNGTGPGPDRTYWFYYLQNQLQAVRRGKWKLILPHRVGVLKGQPGGRDGKPVAYTQTKMELALYNLEADPGETLDRSQRNPRVLRRMLREVELARQELGDSLTARSGSGTRDPGRSQP